MGDDLDQSPRTLQTADDLDLEAELATPPHPRAAAVLTHPHPLYGGDMRSLVTGELFRHLPRAGVQVLRFNFRGVGSSEGEHGDGRAEVADVEAAIGLLAEEASELPLLVAGWSFGADVSLRVDDGRLVGWCAVAPPLRVLDDAPYRAADDPRPKLLVIPEHDQFDPPDRVREVTADWTNTRIEVVAGADHFLVGRTDRVAELCLGFIDELS